MIPKERSTKIVNFMTPRVGILVLRRGHMRHIGKMHSSKKLSVAMMPKEESTKTVNLITPGQGFLCLGVVI